MRATAEQLILHVVSKTNLAQPYVATAFVVVEDSNRATMETVSDLLRRLQPESFLTQVSTHQLRVVLKRYPETKMLTGHSFKRGAIDVVIAAAVRGECEWWRIPILARHKTDTTWFPQTTVGYTSNHADLAVMFGTQNLTKLL